MKHLLLLLILSTILAGCSLTGETDYEDEEPRPTVSTVSESESESSSVSSEPLLPRDFSLPIPLFAPNSAWNQTASTAAVLPYSDEQILVTFRVLLGDVSALEGYDEPATTWPYMDVNVDEYTIPIFRSGDEKQDVVICIDEGVLGWPLSQFGIDKEGGPVTVPAPMGTVRPAGPENEDADGHLVLYDENTLTAYDYYAAVVDGQGDCTQFMGGMQGRRITEAGEVAYFDMRGSGTSPEGESSARAHGTPLLAGLILPEDIENGEIAHALALAIPGPRNLSQDPYEPLSSDYFYPASTTETDFYSTDPMALAAGQRVRLKQSLINEDGEPIDESELAPITRLFLDALRTYGAYVVDNAGGFSFYAEDVHTAVLHLSDEEVNVLIAHPPGTPLPPDKTKWEIVLEVLGHDLEGIPFAISPGDDVPDPESAEVAAANFEVVEPAYVALSFHRYHPPFNPHFQPITGQDSLVIEYLQQVHQQS